MKRGIISRFGRNSFSVLLPSCLLLTMATISCSDNDTSIKSPVNYNSAEYITDKGKLVMLQTMVDLEGGAGRIYEINYTADYKLEDALNANIDDTDALVNFVISKLYDVKPTQPTKATINAGCSAFACPDPETGHYLMGRNFDFNHIVNGKRIPIPVIAVVTNPEGGKKSVSFVDGLFLGYTRGFLTDGKQDLSLLMGLPYVPLDGINEDGFAVSVLKLDGKPTLQQEPGKKKIFTTVAMRMLLDRASTVEEAVSMLKEYNMCMDKANASYHFFMADAKGNSAIVEYVDSDINVNPSKIDVLTGSDTLRYVTNFYVSPEMAATPYGSVLSDHGKSRYEVLRKIMKENNYALTESEAMDLLSKVYQGAESTGSTGYTQWSEVFDLTNRSVRMSLIGEYGKTFKFKVR